MMLFVKYKVNAKMLGAKEKKQERRVIKCQVWNGGEILHEWSKTLLRR